MRNPYLSLLRTAWKYANHEKKKFVLIYGLFAIANIAVAMNPLFYGWFINELQQHETDVLKTGWIYVVGFLSLRLVEWIFHGPARVMERRLAFNISRNFLNEHYHKVLHLPVKWHQENHSGATINRLRKAYEALRDFFQEGFIYLYSFGKFIFSFAAMLYFSPLFGSIGVVLGAITVWIIMKFDVPYVKTLKQVNEKEHKVSSTLFDSLSNIITVITLRLEKRMQTGLTNKVEEVYPPFKKNVTVNEVKWFTAQMMVGLIYAVTTIGYIYQHYTPGETFLIGGLIILLGYVNQFTSVFNDIAANYTQIVKHNTDVQNASEFEKAFEEMHVKDELTLPKEWKEIRIQHLNFKRERLNDKGKITGIHDLHLVIKKGKRIALIGESGSGKSTLLSLLRGLHDPILGSVVSADQHSIDFESISSSVTLFPQEPEIFENTILYNITMGLPFTDEEVMQVCEKARFADVVKQLPDGLQTNMQEKGVNLSGGQKQRLALARGILAAQNSDIVLMDEPTSSIDSRTEKRIYQNLLDDFKNKAVVSSMHRLHLLADFDYIYILNEGSVIDEGTFDNLSRYSLVFKDMWEHQIIKPEDNDPDDETNYQKLNVAL